MLAWHVQEAGIPVRRARTIGIAVDHRRRNRSLESLQVSRQFVDWASQLLAWSDISSPLPNNA